MSVFNTTDYRWSRRGARRHEIAGVTVACGDGRAPARGENPVQPACSPLFFFSSYVLVTKGAACGCSARDQRRPGKRSRDESEEEVLTKPLSPSPQASTLCAEKKAAESAYLSACKNYRAALAAMQRDALPLDKKQLEVGCQRRLLLRLPSFSTHHTPTTLQLNAREAELAKFRAQLARAEATVLFKEAQLEFLNFGSQPSGSVLADVVYEALERVRPEDVDKRIEKLEAEIEKLKSEMKELEEKIMELKSEIKALQSGEGERRRGSSFW